MKKMMVLIAMVAFSVVASAAAFSQLGSGTKGEVYVVAGGPISLNLMQNGTGSNPFSDFGYYIGDMSNAISTFANEGQKVEQWVDTGDVLGFWATGSDGTVYTSGILDGTSSFRKILLDVEEQDVVFVGYGSLESHASMQASVAGQPLPGLVAVLFLGGGALAARRKLRKNA